MNPIPKKILEGTIDTQEELNQFIKLSEEGSFASVEQKDGNWIVNQGYQKCINAMFKFRDNQVNSITSSNPSLTPAIYDKIQMQFSGFSAQELKEREVRLVPGSIVRETVHVGKKTVIMPSFINIGAFIGEGTMVDIGACVGSCAYIGKKCHISGNSVIGGVLEPVGSQPVIIEDGCMIGANASVTEGVIIGKNSVISSGCHISASTKIFNRETKETHTGYVPANSVVVPGIVHSDKETSLISAIIVKQKNKSTEEKTKLNSKLRP